MVVKSLGCFPSPGVRASRRGSMTSRPWSPDWADEQLILIYEFISRNPWICEKFGPVPQVSVLISDDDELLTFTCSAVRGPVNGGMGAVAPMQSVWGSLGSDAGRVAPVPHDRAFPARYAEQKKAPASAPNTPGAVINIQEGNADGSDCRS